MKHIFFLVIAPGLETLAHDELEEKLKLWGECGLSSSVCAVRVLPGGLQFEATLVDGFALNHILKIPTRILLRLKSFKAKDFSELFKQAQKVEWPRYLRQGEVSVKVSTQGSRLKIKNRIEQTLLDSLAAVQKKSPFRKSFLKLPNTIFVRAVDDQFELSIDTSGEPLYKRGWEKHIGPAPLRETLASAVYFSLWKKSKCAPDRVIDPLCGSGTLLWEACDFFQVNRARKFSFQDFPVFKGIEYSLWPKELAPRPMSVGGYDNSSAAIELVESNLKRRLVADLFTDPLIDPLTDLAVNDIFEINTSEKIIRPEGVHWLITNPPYDVRLIADLKKLAFALETMVYSSNQIAAAACIWPQAHWHCRPFKTSDFLKIKNGGIEVGLITYLK